MGSISPWGPPGRHFPSPHMEIEFGPNTVRPTPAPAVLILILIVGLSLGISKAQGKW